MDVRQWVIGTCWRCEAPEVLVLWLGPVQTVIGSGPFQACQGCIRRLEELVAAYADQLPVHA
ncbi:hypothetical protein [Actinacidiphila rubida]|uniref:ClpX-type ZB domain-containing protein n=1 Tax=Actinacidiphila rubida TaxID=310780 RepID=A0A1H8QMV9_9ACTN|nr:hypothetical protein [Actinacidiphila rubida]SEO55331.1 hypothetical protein SAMN05216267_103074 [Actinacidiphila rubida]